MTVRRAIFAGVAVAGLVAGAFAMPAIGATESTRTARKPVAAAARALSGFTPAAADPRLSALFARGGLDRGSFRFTPSETRRDSRAVTVAVRARSNRTAEAERIVSAAAPTVGLAPIAYNLGVAVGWKRFAVSGDVSKVDLAGQPGGREAADLAVSYAGTRFTGQVRAAADKPIEGSAPRLIEGAPSYSLDVRGSYSLTRNLDVTAGVRYKSERDRLVRFTDDRRDSQAVYVGTAFRF